MSLAGPPAAGRRRRMRRATALTATLLFLAHGAPAGAQSAGDRTGTGTGSPDRGVQLAQASEPTRFSIAPQDLNGALLAFAEETGLQLFYEVDKLRGLETDGLQGSYMPDRALQELLAGTGLTYSFTDDGGVRIAQANADAGGDDGPAQLGPITVEAETEDPYGPANGYKADRSATATRLDLPVEETPAPVQVIPRQIIEDSGADRVEDALDYTAGTQERNAFGNTNDGINLRGFRASFAEDGSVSQSPNADLQIQRDSATVERVEVLRGPASALYGEGSPGGIVNVITKRPQDQTFITGDTVVSTFERYRQTFDANAAVGAEKALKLRLSGALERSDSFRDEVDGDRQVVAPAVTFEPTPDLTIAYRGEYIRDSEEFDRGVPLDADGDPLADRSAFFGDPTDGDIESETGRNQLELSYDVTDAWTARGFASWTYNSFEGRASDPLAISPISRGPIVAGDTIIRPDRERDFEANIFTGRAEVTGAFETGPIRHKTLFSFEARQIDDDQDFANSPLTADLISARNPQIDTPDAAPTNFRNTRADVTNYGLIAFDQITPWEPLKFLVGGRLDFVDQDLKTTTNTGTTQVSEDATEFSPSLGVVLSPFDWGSIFARYSESFQVNTESGPQGQIIDPQQGESVEVGVRANLFDGDLTATVTAFDIALENVPFADAFGNFSRPTDQDSRGVEVSLQGQLTDGLSLVANYTYTDAEILSVPNLGTPSRLAAVPKHEANLFANYEFQQGRLEGLSLNAGVIYTDERLNTIERLENFAGRQVRVGGKELDSFVRVDVGAGYQIADWLSASVQVKNLFDEEYERPSTPDFGLPGAPRTYIARLSLKF